MKKLQQIDTVDEKSRILTVFYVYQSATANK